MNFLLLDKDSGRVIDKGEFTFCQEDHLYINNKKYVDISIIYIK